MEQAGVVSTDKEAHCTTELGSAPGAPSCKGDMRVQGAGRSDERRRSRAAPALPLPPSRQDAAGLLPTCRDETNFDRNVPAKDEVKVWRRQVLGVAGDAVAPQAAQGRVVVDGQAADAGSRTGRRPAVVARAWVGPWGAAERDVRPTRQADGGVESAPVERAALVVADAAAARLLVGTNTGSV
jgi:hypothetical protein